MPSTKENQRTATINLTASNATDLAILVASPRGTAWRPLPRGEILDVGRAVDAFVSLDDDGVSRCHLRIRYDGTVRIEDLGSKNGSTLDGRPMVPNVSYEWHRGSCVVLGNTSLMLQAAVDAPPPSPSGHAVTSASSRWELLLDRIAEQDVSVLILGETGTGKEVTAERVHAASPRQAGPLVKLHPASFSPGLLESELFGHERGSFTGAHRARVGLIEQAHGGTLFMDEVGELPHETQIKLLRVLEDRSVRRVGGDHDKVVDFRLIAATHRDLEEQVRLGRFRADLYFRLATFTVRLPALRDRRQEIEPLANTLLAKWALGRTVSAPALAPDALHSLLEYQWPGNVRELKAVLERAAIVSDGLIIRHEDLPLEDMRRRSGGSLGALRPEALGSSEAAPRPEASLAHLDDERARILNALQECAGNQTRAAEMLGVSRRTLLYKLDALNLPRPQKRPRRSK